MVLAVQVLINTNYTIVETVPVLIPKQPLRVVQLPLLIWVLSLEDKIVVG